MNPYIVNRNIKKFRNQIISDVDLSTRKNLHISEHVAERIVLRHMKNDIPLIGAIAKNFYDNVFSKTTYNERTYKIGFRKLFVCFKVRVGAVSGERTAILTTTFEGENDYFVDEVINLKV